MAGYGAVVSLQQTIDRILESSRLSLDSSSREIIQLAYMELHPLLETLARLDGVSPSKSRKKVNALDRDIKDAVWRFEDSLESLLSDQILSQLERDGELVMLFSIDLQSLRRHVDSFTEELKDLQKRYDYELDNMPELEEDESAFSSSRNGKAKMVGFLDIFEEAKYDVTHHWEGNSACAFVGMPGSGKTTLAHKIFEDDAVLRRFDHRVWVTVGRKYDLCEIERCILDQVDPSNINGGDEDNDRVREKLKERLEGKKCLLVLDNIWDTDVLDHFIGDDWNYTNDGMFRILVTSNLQKVADIRRVLCKTYPMRPLDDKESEELLREKVFGGDDFPQT